jgi:hypothetical protein
VYRVVAQVEAMRVARSRLASARFWMGRGPREIQLGHEIEAAVRALAEDTTLLLDLRWQLIQDRLAVLDMGAVAGIDMVAVIRRFKELAERDLRTVAAELAALDVLDELDRNRFVTNPADARVDYWAPRRASRQEALAKGVAKLAEHAEWLAVAELERQRQVTEAGLPDLRRMLAYYERVRRTTWDLLREGRTRRRAEAHRAAVAQVKGLKADIGELVWRDTRQAVGTALAEARARAVTDPAAAEDADQLQATLGKLDAMPVTGRRDGARVITSATRVVDRVLARAPTGATLPAPAEAPPTDLSAPAAPPWEGSVAAPPPILTVPPPQREPGAPEDAAAKLQAMTGPAPGDGAALLAKLGIGEAPAPAGFGVGAAGGLTVVPPVPIAAPWGSAGP